jgi:serine/threonine protein kinase
MAPEILEGKSYTEKCDLWSLGIIIFQMLTGDIPFNLRYLKIIVSIVYPSFLMIALLIYANIV